MKEARYFYVPDAGSQFELPSEEASHATRVLRMTEGDELFLMDGKGSFFRAVITAASNHRCSYKILDCLPQQTTWTGHLHIAMAPTKLIDRTEWFAEKATEIGIDQITFLNCQFSERRVVKEERIEKIIISAMKQSRKAWKPMLNQTVQASKVKASESHSGTLTFHDFIAEEREGDKFICHCYDALPSLPTPLEKPFLFDILRRGAHSTVLIGPEGDFSIEEVRLAIDHGYQSVSLGPSRLRTETAALVAVHMMQLKNTIL